MENNRLTTTNISVEQLKHLKKISDRLGLKQVEFINASVSYFQKTGINPAEDIFTPREEIEKLAKRLDEVIRFMQVHERNKLSPLLERLILLEKQLNESYSTIISIKDLEPIKNLLEEYKVKITKIELVNEQAIPNLLKKILIGLETVLARILEEQNKKQKKTERLIGALFNALKNKPLAGGFKDNDIKNFEDAIRQV